MRIALGSDHRGAKIAKKIVADVLLREHYVDLADPKHTNDELVGAYLIVGATISDSFGKNQTNVATSEEPSKIFPISYRGAQNCVPVETDDIPSSSERTVRGVDYPDVAAAVAEAVAKGEADKGILICGTGIGMSLTANKFRSIRAAVCYNEVAAELSRRHNNANVLCLSGEFLGVQAIESLVRVWLTTPYEGGRHQRRVEKIDEIEKETGL